jgi:hypothetical protein
VPIIHSNYSYYPGNAAYSSGYTIMHRNYYGERPDHYDNGYRQGHDYFPHHDRHDQYSVQRQWGNNHRNPGINMTGAMIVLLATEIVANMTATAIVITIISSVETIINRLSVNKRPL